MTIQSQGDVPVPATDLSEAVAVSEVTASLYRELHGLAMKRLHYEHRNHSLQPTALVHEAFLRLQATPGSIWKERPRVLGLAAKVMRHILVDHARGRRSLKRGQGDIPLTFDENVIAGDDSRTVDVLIIDEALKSLEQLDARQAEILELHFFGGLSFDEIAVHLGVTGRTVKRDWAMARAWLRQQLSSKP